MEPPNLADSPLAELKYWYSKSGKIEMRLANGRLQKYAYDRRGQLVQVSGEDGKVLEKYAYDAAGNILEKTAFGKTTTYRYDAANQLVSSKDADGKVTEYSYDAAGRMTREGAKTYRYGYLDKVLSVAEGKDRRTFTYHVDGQLATATRTGGTRLSRPGTADAGGLQSPATETETFFWDGFALIRRGSTAYVNEPHPGGGAAVASSGDGVMFNDVLGTTLGTECTDGYVPVELSAFGDTPPSHLPTSLPSHHLFTGKPSVDGLGYAFLFRNYRAGLGKWQTADPLGYPDGWNQMAYCGNELLRMVDFLGCFPISNAVESALEDEIGNFFNDNSINTLIQSFGGSTPSDDVHISGHVSLLITNIKIYYNHFVSGDTDTSADDYKFNTNINQTIRRTQPDVYTQRNASGDRNGASLLIGDGSALHLDLSGLSITDDILGIYSVTITRITCDYNLLVSVNSRYLNYVKE